jgi:hypothetical protein
MPPGCEKKSAFREGILKGNSYFSRTSIQPDGWWRLKLIMTPIRLRIFATLTTTFAAANQSMIIL